MTPKEKALSLVYSYEILIKYDSVLDLRWHDASPENEKYHKSVKKDAKRYALRAVEEIINMWFIVDMETPANIQAFHKYWISVKKEIQKL